MDADVSSCRFVLFVKGWCSTRLSMCCRTRKTSDRWADFVLYETVVEVNSGDRIKATWQSYGTTTKND